MDHAVGCLLVGQPFGCEKMFAQCVRLVESSDKKVLINRRALYGQQAANDLGVRIQIPASQEFSASIMYVGKVPGFHLLGPVCHLVAIHPQMARQELGFFARQETDTMDWFHGDTFQIKKPKATVVNLGLWGKVPLA